jgi:hypothetical protein
MTKKQLKLYKRVCKHVLEMIGYGYGKVNGLAMEFEVGKGTWYVQGHGYLDDLVYDDELPIALMPNAQSKPRRESVPKLANL